MDIRHIASRKQEGRIAKSLRELRVAATQTIASGALWIAKSDVITKRFRIEAKTRAKASSSMVVKKEWLDKISLEAFETGKIPLLAFSFGNGKDYFIIEDKHLYEIISEIEKQEG